MEKSIDKEKILAEIKSIYRTKMSHTLNNSMQTSLDERFDSIALDFISSIIYLYNTDIRAEHIRIWKIREIKINSRGNYSFDVIMEDVHYEDVILPQLFYSDNTFTDIIDKITENAPTVTKNIKWVYDRLRLSHAHHESLKSLFKDKSIDDLLSELN